MMQILKYCMHEGSCHFTYIAWHEFAFAKIQIWDFPQTKQSPSFEVTIVAPQLVVTRTGKENFSVYFKKNIINILMRSAFKYWLFHSPWTNHRLSSLFKCLAQTFVFQ